VALEKTIISNPKANAGGLAYIDFGLSFSITNSEVTNIQANKSSGIYSSSVTFTLNIQRTNFLCDSKYRGEEKRKYLVNGENLYN
jgi:hypothetical protein